MNRSTNIQNILEKGTSHLKSKGILAFIWGKSELLFPQWDTRTRKAVVMYYWARAQRGNLKEWGGWGDIQDRFIALKYSGEMFKEFKQRLLKKEEKRLRAILVRFAEKKKKAKARNKAAPESFDNQWLNFQISYFKQEEERATHSLSLPLLGWEEIDIRSSYKYFSKWKKNVLRQWESEMPEPLKTIKFDLSTIYKGYGWKRFINLSIKTFDRLSIK